MSDFHFLRPGWLFALLPLFVLLWWRFRNRPDEEQWRPWVEPHLLRHLLLHRSTVSNRLAARLATMIAILSVLALAGPSWQRLPTPHMRPAASPLVIALSLSRSMDTPDLGPSRLARTREKLQLFLAQLPPKEIGLIAFAGGAYRVVPLTEDRQVVAQLLDRLNSGLMPIDGHNLRAALLKADDLLRQAGKAKGQILLLTDAVDAAEQAIEVASRLSDAGRQLLLLNVGDRLQTDADKRGLKAIADAAAGSYQQLTADDQDLQQLLQQVADTSVGPVTQEENRQLRMWRDRGPWLLLALLPLALIGFRRGWLGLFLLPILLPSPPAQALDWEQLWHNQEQRALSAFAAGDLQRAETLTHNPMLQGIIRYRRQDYGGAIELFSQIDTPRAHYNRGNALLRLGRLDQALAAYERALVLDPNDRNARYNRDLVIRMQKQLAPAGKPPASTTDKRPEKKPVSRRKKKRSLHAPDEITTLNQAKGGTEKPGKQDNKETTHSGGTMLLQEDGAIDKAPTKGGAGQSAAGKKSRSRSGQATTLPEPDKKRMMEPPRRPRTPSAPPPAGAVERKPAPVIGSGLPPSGTRAQAKPSDVASDNRKAEGAPPVKLFPQNQGKWKGEDAALIRSGQPPMAGRSMDTLEQRQARRQWLERVPAQDGGLLRELFRREHLRGEDYSRPGKVSE